MGVERFTVEVPQATLDDLVERLARTRWPGELDGPGWEDGTSPAYLRELVGWWQAGFDWRAQEAALNRFPQFRATVDGIGLHFVHVRGGGPAPLPLILTHGWPSTFYELLPLVGLLTDPASHGGDPADAFDVVIPRRRVSPKIRSIRLVWRILGQCSRGKRRNVVERCVDGQGWLMGR